MHQDTSEVIPKAYGRWRVLFAVSSMLAVGCADGSEDRAVGAEAASQEVVAAEAEDDGVKAPAPGTVASTSGRDPAGSYFADITANGPGCPVGTLDTRVEGGEFKTFFTAFVAKVDPQKSVDLKNCQLSLAVVGPARQFAVRSLRYAGHAVLEAGVKARPTTTVSLPGVPAQGVQAPAEPIVGPYDDAFSVEETFEPVWSACVTSLSVHINSTLQVINGNPRGAGEIRIERAPEVDLISRPCTP
jgi:hypothetical protein